MSKLYWLTVFLLDYYWRKSKFIAQFMGLALVAGILFDPRYAPYEYQYIILAKNYYLILLGLITAYQLSKINYKQQIKVILTRVKWSQFYISSVIVSSLIVIGFSLLLDIYLVIFTGLSVAKLIKFNLIAASGLNISLAVVVTHLFSYYTIKSRLRLLNLVVLGLGSLPTWYNSLPAEQVFKLAAYLLPPINYNLVSLLKGSLSWGVIIHSIGYTVIALVVGIWLSRQRSLADLH